MLDKITVNKYMEIITNQLRPKKDQLNIYD